MTSRLPVLGAALSLQSLRAHRDWLLERQRDLEIQDFFRADVLDRDWRSTASDIKSALDGYRGRLGIHGPFWGFKIDSHDPAIRQVVTKRLLQGLEAAEFIGATQMVIHSPFTTWDYNNLDLYPDNRANLIERVRATLAEVISRAENTGCEIVIENIEDKDPHARVQLAAALGSKLVRVSLDTGHAFYAHMSTRCAAGRLLRGCCGRAAALTFTFRTATAMPTDIGRPARAPFAGARFSVRSPG